MSERPRPRAEILLAAASTAFLLVLLAATEAWLRTRETPGAGILALHRYSETYGWEPRPGARIVQSGKRVSVNRAGYRGPELPLLGDRRETRLLLLGDSITFGLEVGDEETFAYRLHAEPGFEVVNLAVDGYGPDQSLLKLEREGLRFEPDVVIMNVCLENDFADAVSQSFLHDGSHPKPYFRLQGDELVLHDAHLKLGWRERLGLRLREGSRLLAAAASLLDRRPEPAHWLDRRDAALRDPQAEALTLSLVARMRALCVRHGARFVVALHPGRDTFRRHTGWSKAFERAPALAGTRVVDLRQEYLARGLGAREVVMDHVGHLTVEGHRAAAEILGRVLRTAPADHVG